MRRAIFTTLLIAAPRAALACPVCFGESDAPLANAARLGIIAMLIVVGGVLSAFAAFIVVLNRRAKLAAIADEGAAVRPSRTPFVPADPQEGIAQC
jgi:hypothetical protein